METLPAAEPGRPDPSRSDPYAGIAALYDLEHAAYDDDVDLYLNFALVTGDPVLELGCGSGRLLLPLAEAGHRVTGLDSSAPMLDRAAELLRENGLADQVTLHRGDMAEADRAPGGPFGIVIVALNGLMHLPTQAAQRSVLTAARRALDPRGQLVLDVLNPTPQVLGALDQGTTHEGSWTDEHGRRVDKFAARRVGAADQTIQTDLWYDRLDAAGRVHRAATSYPMRYLHRAELELMLETAGFAEWQVYGGYDLEPFGDACDRLIVTAEVTASR
jgi:SAM-dependent methyltransferase